MRNRLRWGMVALAPAVVLVGGAAGASGVVGRAPAAQGGTGAPVTRSALERFATLTFGSERAAASALAAGRSSAGVPSSGTLRGWSSGSSSGRGSASSSQAAGSAVDNPLAPSSYRTPNGWALNPAGTQIDTPRAPTGITVSPDGRSVLAVNSGIFDEQLVDVDAATLVKTESSAGDLFMGVAADHASPMNVWASGGNRNKVWHYVSPAAPVAVNTSGLPLVPGSPNRGISVVGYPGNSVLSPDGKTLFVVGNLSIPESVITGFDAGAGTCPHGAPAAPGTPICSVVNVIDVSDPSTSTPSVHLVPVGRDAYGIAVSPDGKALYVSNWADETNPARTTGSPSTATGTVSVVDVGRGREVQHVAVGHHPTGLALSPDGSTVVVANSADDTVSVLPVLSDHSLGSPTSVSTTTVPAAPRGATPLSVAFSPAGDLLYIGLAGENAALVLTGTHQTSPVGTSVTQVIGKGANAITVPNTYVPTGWYPSALATGPQPGSSNASDSRLYVTNLKGMGSGPGLNGQAEPLMGTRTEGTLSAIDVPGEPVAREAQLNVWTATVVANNNWDALFRSQTTNVCQAHPKGPLCQAATDPAFRSHVHVIEVVKENKTFDQYFGDLKSLVPDADADPTWLLYGTPVTTNQHLLAAKYKIDDHFWADSEQSTTGHKWMSAGYVTEHDEMTWNTEYDQGLRGDRSDGQYAPSSNPANGPKNQDIADQEGAIDRPATRLADATEAAGISTRVYSDDVNPGSLVLTNADRIPESFWGIGASNNNHGRDLDFPDTDRADVFLHGRYTSHDWSVDHSPLPPPGFGSTFSLSSQDQAKFSLDGWEAAYRACISGGGNDDSCQSAMPQFLYMALPIDHTLGFNPLSPTPASMVANNDLAVGRLVDALSKSDFWKDTLLLIAEDDTQASGDHVDAHRTFLLASGGLAAHAESGEIPSASHEDGSFPAMLRTAEGLLGVAPLTIFDTAASPLSSMLTSDLRDLAPDYHAVPTATVFAINPPATPTNTLGRLSETMDWRLDHSDPLLLRDLLYAGIRGWPLPAADLARLHP